MNFPVDPSFKLIPKIPPEEIAKARLDAVRSGRRVIEILEEQLAISPRNFIARLGRTLGYPVMRMTSLHNLKPAFDVVPLADAAKWECVAFRDSSNTLLLIFADPFAPNIKAWAEERVSESFKWVLVHPADLTAYLARHEESVRAMDGLIDTEQKSHSSETGVEDISLAKIREDESPVVKLVNSTLYDALKSGASDIHFETGSVGLNIKYRLDGVLVHIGKLSGIELAERIISRIKVMAELDIAERRVPQDGRFKVSVNKRDVDFRVSIMPSSFGEDAVLRILDKQSLTDRARGLRLDVLGFDEETMTALRKLAAEPYGMLLVTGPTGSGKTTTLYAAITEINNGQDKIITIEDPVEYQLHNVLQIPVNEKKGLTFARGLRSILRHDPDKILVGEIRDPETAQIAVQAALTGHLVLTTVHANSAFDVIGRFVHMGVDPYNFVAAMNGIVAQRLVRVICTHCAQDFVPSKESLESAGIDAQESTHITYRTGAGCGNCRGTGYKGRKAIAEVVSLDDELRELIIAKAPMRQLREAVRRKGTRFLREKALDLVKKGETTLQEINRVTLVV